MKIQIENYPLSLKIGHFQAERQFVRTVFVSLSLRLSPPKKEMDLENLDKTVDYGQVIEFLEEEFSGKTVRLIETLLYLLARGLMFKFPMLEGVGVRIQKTHMRPSLIKGAIVTVEENFEREHFLLQEVVAS